MDTYRYDDVYELDMRLAKTFNIGGVTIIPAVELFNVANSGTVLQRYQRTGTFRSTTGDFTQSQFFNQILEVQSPRIVRLGHLGELLVAPGVLPGPVREFRTGPVVCRRV